MKKKNKSNPGKKSRYWKAQKISFINSFKRVATKRFVRAAAYDLLTFFLIFLFLNLGFSLANRISIDAYPELLNVYAAGQADDGGEAVQEALTELAPKIKRVLILVFVTFAVAFLLAMLCLTLFYRRAWSIALGETLKKFFSWKYFLLNILWFAAWLIIFLLTANIFVTGVAALIFLLEMLFFLYMDPLLRALYNEKKGLKRILSDFFRISPRIHWFVFYVISALILGMLLLLILGLLTRVLVLFIILTIMFFVFFIGWSRVYVVELARHIKIN